MAQQTTLSSVLAEEFKKFKRDLLIGLPAKVTDVSDYATMQRINVKPQMESAFIDGEYAEYPEVRNVPVRLSAVNGGAITLPISVGDLVWLNFSSASIDEFLAGIGDITRPTDSLGATINDCYVELGFPTFRTNTTPSATDLQIYFRDSVITLKGDGDMSIVTNGNAEIQTEGNLTATSKGTVSVTSEQSITLTAPNVVINGATNINGTLEVSETILAQQTISSAAGMLAPSYSGFAGGAGTMTIGTITTSGDVTVNGISYLGHRHNDAENRPTGTPI